MKHIYSIAGLHLEAIAIPIGMYGPSKYGLRALGIELRHEINAAKLNVKITVHLIIYICIVYYLMPSLIHTYSQENENFRRCGNI